MRTGIFGLIAVFGILFLGATFQKNANNGQAVQPYYPMQESNSIDGSVVKTYFATAGDQIWVVKDNAGISTNAKAIRVNHGTAAGVIWVHLVDKPDTLWDKYYFEGGVVDKEGAIFDKIRENGTTLNLDSTYILE